MNDHAGKRVKLERSCSEVNIYWSSSTSSIIGLVKNKKACKLGPNNSLTIFLFICRLFSRFFYTFQFHSISNLSPTVLNLSSWNHIIKGIVHNFFFLVRSHILSSNGVWSGVSGKGFLAPGNGKGNWKSHSRFTGREREFTNCYGKGREGKFEACNPGNPGKSRESYKKQN